MKFYNTAGPVNPARHYHLPPLSRFDLDEVMMLIHQEKYFILHAPRQTGKTSTLLALMAYLNNRDDYSCLYVNIESAQAARGDVEKGTFEVIGAIAESASVYLEDDRLREWIQEEKAKRGPYGALSGLLSRWSRASAKPVVLLLDEVDALVGDTLISLLRQIRAGYAQRPDAFPQSMVLCGVRDVRDYRMHQEGGEVITGGSVFNIKAKSLRMVNFTDVEVKKLFQQHTEETGQAFDRAIFAELWEDTRGQPWLVNALGHELTWEDRSARDRSIPITLECYKAARERLIESRATHLDQLTDKLKEPRVHAVIAALLSGEQSELQASDDDLQYVTDLGLIVRKPQVRISNRIYREVIPRELTAVTQDTMVQESSWYLTAENRLDLPKLLTAFQQCFREHSESWIERFDYKEAGPQLLMQAFLQRILNGGGRIYREYALGRKRTDLSIEWPLQRLPVPSERGDEVEGEPDWHGPIQRIVIELKIQRGGLESTIEKGLEQTAEYADQFGADESHLVIFNRDPDLPWEAKIWHCAEIRGTRILGVWGA